MIVLGIETSCDETAVAVVKDGCEVLSNVICSQIDIHKLYGGVVPEIAARSHIEVINPIINQALGESGLGWDEIDNIAVTYAPGLVGSLLIGTLAARTLALIKNKPLYPVNHIEAHLYANFITKLGGQVVKTNQPDFPLLALIVSGGHSQIIYAPEAGSYKIIGQTQDDAIGEAFDKVAKILGLSYPGGPSIAKAAQDGNPLAYPLPQAKLTSNYDFSFSGLKTATLRAIQREAGVDINFPSSQLASLLKPAQINDFAASFQAAAIKALVDRLTLAYNDLKPNWVVVAGGVASNQYLRQELNKSSITNLSFPPAELCTDNGAMVASLGYFSALSRSPVDPLSLDVLPNQLITQNQFA